MKSTENAPRRKGSAVMAYLQRLGKAMMMPIAVLPICGIMMGLGYLLCPAAIQGGSVAGILPTVGYFLVKAGSAVIDHMALLFVIGISLGMSENQSGAACLAGLASWLVITTLLSPAVAQRALTDLEKGTVRYLAFEKIENPFTGILAGLIGATCFNRFQHVHLPDTLAFFSGKRFVPIVALCVSFVVSLLLLLIWPVVFSGIVQVGQFIVGLGGIGVGIYAFLNRLLIPLGLHHALNSVFWFDLIGIGDLTNFWAGKAAADVGWSLGMYMSGFFPCMMFGLPGAALAMYRSAKDKGRAKGLLGSGALCSALCGLTEPLEFSFMFAAYPLYVLYSALYGIFSAITYYTGFRAGFSFSAGAIDLIFSASLPAAQKTWLILPLGAAAFIVFYFSFRLMIVKMDLHTPGREAPEEQPAAVPAEAPANEAGDRFQIMARRLLKAVGGRGNVTSADCCATRLRLELKDTALVDQAAAKAAGALGVMVVSGTACQIIIGMTVQQVLEAFQSALRETDTETAEAAPVRRVKRGETILKLESGGPFTHVIQDRLGIHARPAAEIAKLLKGFDCRVAIRCGEKTAEGTSILQLMKLGARLGTELSVTAEGPDAAKALRALRQFMQEHL